MKAGAESKTKIRVAIALGVVAILSVAWTLMPARRPSPESGPATAAPSGKGRAPLASESLDPRLHLDLLESSARVKYEGKGTNIFRTGAEPVEISKANISPLLRQQQEQAKVNAHLPPPLPKIPLNYFGIINGKGERPKVFLSQGEDVWIAREGDVVNRRYKIVRISPAAVEVEDLLNNNRQTITLTQG